MRHGDILWVRDAEFDCDVVLGRFALVLDLSAGERALLLALGLLLLAAELFNTAIEAAVDFVSTARDPRAAMAKDCASAAVALTALAGFVAWCAILWG